ncbi:MAG TPA: acyl-CoA dehydrogenase, partial [Myxococcales bacterium]|nr:acyl-CoA dehydrogenase [Myxococcales bacterium]
AAIEVYAMDSVLGRTLAVDPADATTPLREGLCREYCRESRERAFDRARTALCAILPAEILVEQIELFSRLHTFVPVNPAEVREQIVPHVLDHGGYPLSY